MEEDTVVIEGSPLADHLKLIGLQEGIVGISDLEEAQASKIHSSITRFWTFITTALHIFKSSIISEVYIPLCIDAILEAELIEDLHLLPILEEVKIHPKCTRIQIAWCFVKKGIRDAMIAFMPAISFCFIPQQALGTKMIALSIMIPLSFSWVPVILAYSQYFILKKHLNYVKNFHDTLRRATVLINESSLLNKGYILNSRNHASAWRLETAQLLDLSSLSEKSLPGLRIGVKHTTSRMALCYSNELIKQRKARPLPYALDHPSLCLPEVEDLIEKESRHDDAVPSLREIKISVEHFLVKQREYFKRILLQLVLDEKNDFFQLYLNKTLTENLMQAVKELTMALVVYKSLYSQNVKCRLKLHGGSSITGRMAALHSVVHSAKGHLEEILRGTISLEELLEDDSFEAEGLHQRMTFWLGKANFHVESVKECIERTSILVSKMACPKPNISSATLPVNILEQKISNEKNDDNVPSWSLPPTDEIYELTGESSYHQDLDEDNWGEHVPELERENTKLVLHELKNVLRAKALDWERRERKLKEQTLGISVHPVESLGQDSAEGILSALGKDSNVPSLSPLVNDGSQGSSSISSSLIPDEGTPGVMSDLSVPVQYETGGINVSSFGNLASEAVAKAKLFQTWGTILSNEEEFVVTEEETNLNLQEL